MKKIPFFKVALDKVFIDRGGWVKYLTLNDFQTQILQKSNPEIFTTEPGEKFATFVQTQIDSYLTGKKVDAEINGAIMNCADMYASGKSITLFAGDYIALYTHFQKGSKK
jgi:hypothetical protein